MFGKLTEDRYHSMMAVTMCDSVTVNGSCDKTWLDDNDLRLLPYQAVAKYYHWGCVWQLWLSVMAVTYVSMCDFEMMSGNLDDVWHLWQFMIALTMLSSCDKIWYIKQFVTTVAIWYGCDTIDTCVNEWLRNDQLQPWMRHSMTLSSMTVVTLFDGSDIVWQLWRLELCDKGDIYDKVLPMWLNVATVTLFESCDNTLHL